MAAQTYPCDWKTETHRVRALVRDTLVRLNMPHLSVEVSWVSSVGCYGRAVFPVGGLKPYLEFSDKLWPYLPQSERDATVVHEVCHFVDWALTPKEERAKSKPHNDRWKRLMWLCGYEPEVTGKVPIPTFVLNRRDVYCLCGSRPVANTKYARILAGTKYLCKKCKMSLSLHRPAPQEDA